MTSIFWEYDAQAMMGKLKAKRFRQIFQYLEQRSGHDETVELLTMVHAFEQSTSCLCRALTEFILACKECCCPSTLGQRCCDNRGETEAAAITHCNREWMFGNPFIESPVVATGVWRGQDDNGVPG
jgi:hypothetical protein